MKNRILKCILCLAASITLAHSQLVIPSDGSDGPLILPSSPTNAVIDLSQAASGVWNANNAGNRGRGIYDSDKWAVVFKYSSVRIPAGVTVTFKNHPTRAPVVWLVQGDVEIDGMVSLDGGIQRDAVSGLIPSEPGPGGFRGGASGPQGGGHGMGPGGSDIYDKPTTHSSSYGNPQILPLIGGSGGTSFKMMGGRDLQALVVVRF
jgi:hypothetical protein